MKQEILAEFRLPIDVNSCQAEFWEKTDWYYGFLSKTLGDINISIEEWNISNNIRSRNVRSFHPANFSFPGLPSHAEASNFFIYIDRQ